MKLPPVTDSADHEWKRDRAHDSAYVAGMKFGWNCGLTENREAFDRALASRGYRTATTPVDQ